MQCLEGQKLLWVTGRTSIKKPDFVKIIDVLSAQDMFEAVDENFDQQDIVIMSAAVADYRPKNVSSEKVKKQDGNMSIELERTDDILKLSVKEKTVNLSAVSLWKQKICLKIQERNLKRKIVI